jgi:endonuclease YncB( thermonuclease family)
MSAATAQRRRHRAGTSSPYHLVISGSFVIVGKQPDGDSVRFVADELDLFRSLRNGHRVRASTVDQSVQLRFEAVDAPELHYGKEAQPRGAEARDEVLRRLGFADVRYDSDGVTVTGGNPDAVPGAILSKAVERNGRPVSFVLLANDAPQDASGTWVELDQQLLERTLNWRLLETGVAYYTVYTSTPHRDVLRDEAESARAAARGVWAADMSGEFVLQDQSSIGPMGQLILPKLFRRATDYLKSVEEGFRGNLADWLLWISAGSRDENDTVVIGDHLEVKLSDLIDQRNRTIVFQPDLLDITFVEK